MTKAELRKIYLVRQKSLSILERKQKSEQIANRFFAEFNLAKFKLLHCFLPIEKFNEIDTKPVFQRIWREFPRIETLLPRVNFQTNEIESLKYSSKTELKPNAWQIHEPLHDDLVKGEKIDAVLVPLLCFDEKGFRVGYGKGFYDKFLAKCRADCLKIGLSYFAPVAEIADTDEFDVKLDFCVLPNEIFTTEPKNPTDL
ncbi:5-formyltetrahydrofolate cyclo-ligase [soil metagenome]